MLFKKRTKKHILPWYIPNKHHSLIWIIFIVIFVVYSLYEGFRFNKIYLIGIVFMAYFLIKAIILYKHYKKNEK